MAGIPFNLVGKSKEIAWGTTILYSDNSDIYEERIRKIGEIYEYLYLDKWRPVKITEEKIKVKGYNQDIIMKIKHTHHGPILEHLFKKG